MTNKFCALLLFVNAFLFYQTGYAASQPLVMVMEIKADIDPRTSRYVELALQHAEDIEADYVVLELDTYGGALKDADDIRTAILNFPKPIWVFINKDAASAGALISIACDSIYMAPGASIGAATVVTADGQAAPDKYQSYMRSIMRSTAEAQGRDPFIAEAMVDDQLEIEGITPVGQVITFSTSEAIQHGYCEAHSLVSSLTDKEGRFSMVIPAQFNQFGLSFNHQYFHGKVVFITPKDQTLTITIKPKREKQEIDKLESKPASPAQVESLSLVKTLVPPEQFVRTKNIDFVRQVTAQISFLPSMGTNLKMGGLIENNFSLNVLSGYAYGVNKFEMGGLVNIIRKDIKGVQIAGLGNVVGQNIHGVQVSGLFNYDRGSLKGIQIAGITNMLKDSLAGTQIAGIGNKANGPLKGLQFAGLYNYAEENVGGIQFSGLVNFAPKGIQSVQFAGLYNKAGKVDGAQVSGLVNYSTDTVQGVQIAGFVNKAKTTEALQVAGVANIVLERVAGAQISSLFNYAPYVGGSQVGLINIADSASGIPVGFFSYIKQGHHRLEFHVTEILPANIAFKTGVPKFYNIFTGGIGAWSGHSRISLGYGLGTEKKLSERYALNFELTNHIIFEKVGFQQDFHSLMRLDVNWVKTASKNFGFSIGPSLNMLFSDLIGAGNDLPHVTPAPYTLIDTEIGNGVGQVWIGGKATVYWAF